MINLGIFPSGKIKQLMIKTNLFHTTQINKRNNQLILILMCLKDYINILPILKNKPYYEGGIMHSDALTAL
jgi:hypothetical protein